jgi:cytoskeletal protein RodZ
MKIKEESAKEMENAEEEKRKETEEEMVKNKRKKKEIKKKQTKILCIYLVIEFLTFSIPSLYKNRRFS